MLKSYFRIMFRIFLKRKTFTLINVLGLATGMAACFLLLLYIQHETGYDEFHQNRDQVYRLALERKYPTRTSFRAIIPPSIGMAVKQEFPEVLESVRIMQIGNIVPIKVEDKSFEDSRVFAADSNFFKVFTGSFIVGDAKRSLHEPNTAVINETTAIRLYGSAQNALAKHLGVNGSQNLVVQAVCRDWPEKSHFQFNILVSMATFRDLNVPNYYDFYVFDYLLLNKNTSAKALEAKLPLVVEKYVAGTIQKGFGESYDNFTKEGNGYRYFLQPIKKIHLYSNLEDEFRPNGSIRILYLLSAIAAFIIFLACINFINLSTAISVERAREVGVRKTFGSNKTAIMRQFLFEAILLSLVSMIMALFLARLLLPVLNTLSGNDLQFDYFLHPIILTLIAVFSILLGIGAGFYPAVIISSFKPILVLKGNFKASVGGIALRNALVVFQFAISIILIICTIVVNNQMQFVLGQQLGFKKDNILALEGLNRLDYPHYQAFVSQVKNIAGVEDWSFGNLPDGGDQASSAMMAVDTRVSRTQKTFFVDERYLGLLNLKLMEGRFFSKDFGTDSLSLVLNESAVKDFGLKKPIGSRITFTEVNFNPADGKSQYVYTVVGVVKDFHFQSLHEKIAPLVLANNARFGRGSLAIRIQSDHFHNLMNGIENAWKKFGGVQTLRYSFLDKRLADLYQVERSSQKIFTAFSLLAIFIACIGLFGLATYSTLQRGKEIGIRKVLGAETRNIIFILSKDFLLQVLLSMLIAFPVAWWVMHIWLQDFAYRIPVSWWIFILAGSIALTTAFITISFQTIRAAVSNPVKSLRTE